MNKKLISLIIASMALGALAGCGGKKPSTSSNSEESKPSETSVISEEESVVPSEEESVPAPVSEESEEESLPAESEEESVPAEESVPGPASEEESVPAEESVPGPVSEESEPAEESEEPLPDTYDLLKFWEGNVAEEFYTVDDTTDRTIIEYENVVGEDAGGWAYVSRSFAYDAAVKERFGEYKKISFTGKLEATTGSDIVMVKVEGTGVSWEKKFNFSSTEKTYEFGLNFVEDWSKVNTMLFFVNRGTNLTGNGTITLTKMELSKEDVNPDYDIAPGMPSVPQGYTYLDDDKAESLSVMYRWGYNAEEFFVTEEKDGGFLFSWEPGNKTNSYSYVSAKVKDREASLKSSGFRRLHFEFRGKAGINVLFKIEGDTAAGYNKETPFVELTGENQFYDLNVAKYLADSEVDAYKVIIFIMPGVEGAVETGGEFFLSACYFDTEEAVVPRVENDSLLPAIFLDDPDFVDDCYTFNNADHVSTIAYTKGEGNGQYQSIKFFINMTEDWFNLADYNRVYAEVVATSNVRILLKPYDNGGAERRVDLVAGEKQIVDYKFDGTINDLEKAFLLFVAPNEEGHPDDLTGTVTITGLRLTKENACVDVDGEVIVNKLIGNAGGVYGATVDELTGDMTVGYTLETNDYAWGEIQASGVKLDKVNQVDVTLVSDVDTHVLLKPCDNGANEKAFALTAGEEVVVSYRLTAKFDVKWGKTFIVIGFNNGDALTGHVTFKGFKFSYNSGASATENVADYASVYIDHFDKVDPAYLLTPTERGVSIAYDKATSDWSSIQAGITLPETWWEIKNYTRVTAKIVADVDVNILLKPFDAGAYEHWFDLKAGQAEYVDFEIDGTLNDLSKKFIIFICAGDNGGALKGNVEITDLRISWPTAALEDDEGKIYVTNLGVGTADYTATPHEDGLGMTLEKLINGDNRWAGAQIFTSARDHSLVKHMHIRATATKACRILVKPNDANEKAAEITTAGEEFEFDLEWDAGYIDAKWVKTILIIDAGDGDQDVTINFAELYFY